MKTWQSVVQMWKISASLLRRYTSVQDHLCTENLKTVLQSTWEQDVPSLLERWLSIWNIQDILLCKIMLLDLKQRLVVEHYPPMFCHHWSFCCLCPLDNQNKCSLSSQLHEPTMLTGKSPKRHWYWSHLYAYRQGCFQGLLASMMR